MPMDGTNLSPVLSSLTSPPGISTSSTGFFILIGIVPLGDCNTSTRWLYGCPWASVIVLFRSVAWSLRWCLKTSS